MRDVGRRDRCLSGRACGDCGGGDGRRLLRGHHGWWDGCLLGWRGAELGLRLARLLLLLLLLLRWKLDMTLQLWLLRLLLLLLQLGLRRRLRVLLVGRSRRLPLGLELLRPGSPSLILRLHGLRLLRLLRRLGLTSLCQQLA